MANSFQSNKGNKNMHVVSSISNRIKIYLKYETNKVQ